MKEIWNPLVYNGELIPGYACSSEGRIRSKFKILSKIKFRNGYQACSVRGKKLLIHRAIKCSFDGLDLDRPEVNHINGIKTDNRLDNLEWVTRSENEKHSYRLGLKTGVLYRSLDDDQVRYIRGIYHKSSRMFGGAALSRKFGISHKAISRLLKNTTYRL